MVVNLPHFDSPAQFDEPSKLIGIDEDCCVPENEQEAPAYRK
jgi:hypothetical protein